MTEDEKWDSIDSELEPSPADEREEAYRKRKEAELKHEEKQDEGIKANRRSILKLGAATAGLGALSGIYAVLHDDDDSEGSREPSPTDVGNEQTPTKTQRNDYEQTSTRTETDTPATRGPTVYENVDQFNEDIGANLVYEEIEAFADTSGYKDAESFDLQYDSKTGDLTVLTEDGEKIGTYPEEFK